MKRQKKAISKALRKKPAVPDVKPKDRFPIKNGALIGTFDNR